MKNRYESELFEAAKNGDAKAAAAALVRGAPVNVGDKWGESPLIYAAQGTSVDLVCQLLEHGARIDWKGESNWTPLFYAVDKNRTEIAQVLIDNGADIDASDTRGKTILYIAISNRNMEIIDHLIERGVKLNTTTRGNTTPLMLAVSKPNNLHTVKRLVSAGADINLKPLNLFAEAAMSGTNGEGAQTLKFLLESGLMYFDTFSNGTSILNSLKNPTDPRQDFSEAIEILETWRNRFLKSTDE